MELDTIGGVDLTRHGRPFGAGCIVGLTARSSMGAYGPPATRAWRVESWGEPDGLHRGSAFAQIARQRCTSYPGPAFGQV
jgi:hypothetical protein